MTFVEISGGELSNGHPEMGTSDPCNPRDIGGRFLDCRGRAHSGEKWSVMVRALVNVQCARGGELLRRFTGLMAAAQQFLRKLNEMDPGTDTPPSEAEWEYAWPAGARGRTRFGADKAQLANYAWVRREAESGRGEYSTGGQKGSMPGASTTCRQCLGSGAQDSITTAPGRPGNGGVVWTRHISDVYRGGGFEMPKGSPMPRHVPAGRGGSFCNIGFRVVMQSVGGNRKSAGGRDLPWFPEPGEGCHDLLG